MPEIWTILKVLQWTTDFFSRKGIEQPRSDAEVLLAHILRKERIELYLHYDQPLTPEELAQYRKAIRRRASHEPIQYITQKQEFWSLEFEVNPDVLIPRPETELLVEQASRLIGASFGRVLELGTGSGAVAIALAKECMKVEIVATDASLQALRVARRNALRHGVAERIHFVAMDLFEALAEDRAHFDLIVTNPPYIGDQEFSRLAPEIAGHEPQLALRGGGVEGLHTIRAIIGGAPPFLKKNGILLIEVGHGQAEILIKETADDKTFEDIYAIKDYSGIPRVIHLRKS